MKLSDLASSLGVDHRGDCDVERVAEIEAAGAGSIVFISDRRYEKYLATTGASAIILTPDLGESCERPCIITQQPRLIYAHVAEILHPPRKMIPHIAGSAAISATARIGDGVAVGVFAVVSDHCDIGDSVEIGDGTHIGAGVSIGHGSRIAPNVTILEGTTIGEDCIIHPGVVIGADGFGFEPDGQGYAKIPQIGGVRVGSDVEIGANTTIDRGAIRDTVIGDGVKLDNQIQIGHNVIIGDNTVISAGCAIGGSARIGEHCLFGGCVAVRDNIEITDNVIITGRTLVSGPISKAGSYSSSTPIEETRSWRRNSARFRSLDELAKRVIQLEKRLAEQDND